MSQPLSKFFSFLVLFATCIKFGANLAIKSLIIDAVTTLSNGALWNESNEQY